MLPADSADATTSVRVGFVVSKAVGGSVVRHRVARRLRHIVSSHLAELAPGSRVVVRALAPAATLSSADLDADFLGALGRVHRKWATVRGTHE